ncbi:MAG: hypothetical protein MZV70_48880 [Desulfobacterales bacterium]|nr:hypothetical protein [Desulfobacterales bacterium]
MAVEIADGLFDIADRLDKQRLYRFAEQIEKVLSVLSVVVCLTLAIRN